MNFITKELYGSYARWKLNKAQMLFLCVNNYTKEETARILKTNGARINNASKSLGISFITQGDKTRKKVEALMNEGHAVLEICELLNIRETTVYNATDKRPGIKNKERSCEYCGKRFFAKTAHQKYCSKYCEKTHSHKLHDIERRKRVKNAVVDKDISLNKLFERDKGVCHICGGLCDWNDYVIATDDRKHALKKYPSIDHVIPLSKGGKHSWENVKLAHLGCNASKGVSV